MQQMLFNVSWRKYSKTITAFFVYGILIFNDDEYSHMKDIDAVFKVLSDNNLNVPIIKSEFNVKSIDFLAQMVPNQLPIKLVD